MKSLTRFALLLLMACATGAAGASAASAAPPEFVPGSPHGLESVLKKTKFETVAKVLVTCKHGGNAGALTGPKTVTVTIHFTECSSGRIPCMSLGANPGEIVTSELDGTLGYIRAAKKMVGLDLSAAVPPFMTFSCGAALSFVVDGSVIGRITPVNTPLLGGQPILKFMQKAGKQKTPSFEGEPIDVLDASINGGAFEEAGLATTDDLFFVPALEEIKA